jgi:hypothetical protein
MWVSFTMHVRIVPYRGKRQEMMRSLQKIAALAYESLEDESSLQLATPGGGQHQGEYGDRGGISGLANGFAVKPQIGQNPAQMSIAGFYEVDRKNIQTYAETSIIAGGTEYDGYRETPATAMPVSTIDNEVKALKTLVEAALTEGLPSNIEWNVWQVDYAGIVYGNRGYHFPR